MDIRVDKALIEQVATNASLQLSDEEKSNFEKDFEDVLSNFSALEKAPVEDKEPSFHPIPVKDNLREDKEEECLSEKETFENIGHHQDKFIRGPKIV